MRAFDWKWIFWQVMAPIIGPVAVSSIFAVLWATGDSGFVVKWPLIIEDVTPWALTFYAITLIGATMNDFLPKMPNHLVLGVSLILVALLAAIYCAFIVIWRHKPDFVAGTGVYAVTFIILLISVGLCYRAAHA